MHAPTKKKNISITDLADTRDLAGWYTSLDTLKNPIVEGLCERNLYSANEILENVKKRSSLVPATTEIELSKVRENPTCTTGSSSRVSGTLSSSQKYRLD